MLTTQFQFTVGTVKGQFFGGKQENTAMALQWEQVQGVSGTARRELKLGSWVMEAGDAGSSE